MEFCTTHMFMFGLKDHPELKKHKILVLDKDNCEFEILIEELVVKSSPLSCKVVDKSGKKHLVPYIRIRKVFNGNDLVWDATDTKLDNVKVIKGY